MPRPSARVASDDETTAPRSAARASGKRSADPASPRPPARSPKKAAKHGLTPQRQRELTGVLLVVIGLLLLLCLATFTRADATLLDGFHFKDYLGLTELGRSAREQVHNWLGLSGAAVANLFIVGMLGRSALVIPLLAMGWGWTIFRGGDYERLGYLSLYGLSTAALVATFVGIAQMPQPDPVWSGGIGGFLAVMLNVLLGRVGGLLLTGTLLAAVVVLLVDLDLQRTADRLTGYARSLGIGGREKLADWQAARAERAEARAEARRLAEEADDEDDEQDEVEEDEAPAPVRPARRRAATQTELLPEGAPGVDTGAIAIANAVLEQQPVVARPKPQPSREEPVMAPRTADLRVTPTRPAVPTTPARSPVADALREPDAAAVQAAAQAEADAQSAEAEQTMSAREREARRALGMLPDEDDDEPTADPTVADEPTVAFKEHDEVRDAVARDPKAPAVRASDDRSAETITYTFPPLSLLDPGDPEPESADEDLEIRKEVLTRTLRDHGIELASDRPIEVQRGPVITLFKLSPAPGVKISRIVSLSDDLSLALAARGIRIIAPIPGEAAVGIEIPNLNPATVRLSDAVRVAEFQALVGKRTTARKIILPVAFGKEISGKVHIADLAAMPHLLVAGATGSGKSVGINTILASLLYSCDPSEVKFVLIDPKKVELSLFALLANHFLAVSDDADGPIITDTPTAVKVLKSLEVVMDKRYDTLAACGMRNIRDYNARVEAGTIKSLDGDPPQEKMPFIVVIIDELADLMITSGKEVEEPIARLAQLARAVGIHLVVATQRPSVDVITGMIKANFPARIAYQVATKIDSRTILDMNGAEQLLGRGDMLFLPPGSPKPIRIQNAFVSTEEVERITEFIGGQRGFREPFALPSADGGRSLGMIANDGADWDELLRAAGQLVVQHQQGSVSLLQRRLRVGYTRAGSLMDQLERAAVVGPFVGSKARDVLFKDMDDMNIHLDQLGVA